MTFGQALQTLAEMYPEKFNGYLDQDQPYPYFGVKSISQDFLVRDITQDSIDTILAEVNHYYEISLAPPDQHVPEPAWTYIAHEHNGCCNCLHGGVIPYKDKLSASKAALIAVVEKLEGEKK